MSFVYGGFLKVFNIRARDFGCPKMPRSYAEMEPRIAAGIVVTNFVGTPREVASSGGVAKSAMSHGETKQDASIRLSHMGSAIGPFYGLTKLTDAPVSRLYYIGGEAPLFSTTLVGESLFPTCFNRRHSDHCGRGKVCRCPLTYAGARYLLQDVRAYLSENSARIWRVWLIREARPGSRTIPSYRPHF